MIDRNMVRTKLMAKFSAEALESILTDIFLGALPFSTEDISTNKEALSGFTSKAFEALNPFESLAKNKDNIKDVRQAAFANELYDIAYEAATTATKREIREATADPKVAQTRTSKDVIDQAAFTAAELDALAKKKSDIDIATISDVIKEKTIKVLKAEKEAHECDELMHEELREAVTESTLFTGENAVSDYLKMKVGHTAPTKYVSLFSKMMDVSLETTLCCTDRTELSIPVIESLTYAVFGINPTEKETALGVLNYVNSFSGAIESAGVGVPSEMVSASTDSALVSALSVLTFLETMHSLHIVTPSHDTLEKFINSVTRVKRIVDAVENLPTLIADDMARLMKEISAAKVFEDLHKIIQVIDHWGVALGGLADNILGSEDKAALVKLHEDVKKAYHDRFCALSDDGTAFDTSMEALEYQRSCNQTLGDLNRVAALYAKKHNVDAIRINVTSAMENSSSMDNPFIQLDMIGTSGYPIAREEVQYNHLSSAGLVLAAFRKVVESSELIKINKGISYYNTDRGRAVI